jgi:2-C-methyl-D-erythritol 4-phosphate cytidylyltransferase
MRVAALVLGAGRGERFRASLADSAQATAAKALLPLAGRTLLAHAIDALLASGAVERVTPVLSPEGIAAWSDVRRTLADASRVAEPVLGGAERQHSMRAGLASLPAGLRIVAVHDAARPLVRASDVARVVAAAREHGAALLATRVRDTIHRVAEGVVEATPERSALWAAQTPQAFRRDWLEEALAKAAAEGWLATDEAALVARLGVAVHVVEGDASNWKITTAEDLRLAEAILRARGAGA